MVGPHLALRTQFFPGCAVRFPGNLVGFAYGFASGLLVSYLVSRTYNGIAGWQDRRREFFSCAVDATTDRDDALLGSTASPSSAALDDALHLRAVQ